MIKISYHGHSCIQLQDGKFDIIFDPFITGNPVTTAKADNLKPNYILVSHGHSDHLGDAINISKRTGAVIIAPFELAMFCSNKGANVHPMHIGGSHNFDFGKVKLTLALHGSAFIDDAGTHYTGNPCGYVVTLSGNTFYFAGDTGLFSDMKMIGELNNIDVAFLPIGDNFTMGPSDALVAAKMLTPKLVIPIHYGTWPIIEQDPEKFKHLLKDNNINCEVINFNNSLTLE